MRDRTGKILIAFLGDVASDIFNVTDAFLMSAGSTRRLVRNIGMLDRQYSSSMQSLQRNGYVKKVNENQFLITPKGISKAKRLINRRKSFDRSKWNGKWIVVIFDIPDDKEDRRNRFRAIIKEMGFIGLQKSVFVAPYADLEQIAQIRDELEITEYVTCFEAGVSQIEDDRRLREKFDLV